MILSSRALLPWWHSGSKAQSCKPLIAVVSTKSIMPEENLNFCVLIFFLIYSFTWRKCAAFTRNLGERDKTNASEISEAIKGCFKLLNILWAHEKKVRTCWGVILLNVVSVAAVMQILYFIRFSCQHWSCAGKGVGLMVWKFVSYLKVGILVLADILERVGWYFGMRQR